jgi:hypothetical protein
MPTHVKCSEAHKPAYASVQGSAHARKLTCAGSCCLPAWSPPAVTSAAAPAWLVGSPHSLGCVAADSTCSSTVSYPLSAVSSACCLKSPASLPPLLLLLLLLLFMGARHAADAPNRTSVSTTTTAAAWHCHSPAAGVAGPSLSTPALPAAAAVGVCCCCCLCGDVAAASCSSKSSTSSFNELLLLPIHTHQHQ